MWLSELIRQCPYTILNRKEHIYRLNKNPSPAIPGTGRDVIYETTSKAMYIKDVPVFTDVEGNFYLRSNSPVIREELVIKIIKPLNKEILLMLAMGIPPTEL